MRVRFLIKRAALIWDVSEARIIGAGRDREVVLPRHAVFLVSHEHAGQSLTQIARVVGDRDHTTVLHGIRNAKAWADHSDVFAAKLQQLIAAAAELPIEAGEQRLAATASMLGRQVIGGLVNLAGTDPRRFKRLVGEILTDVPAEH
jgi:hypothetical protein